MTQMNPPGPPGGFFHVPGCDINDRTVILRTVLIGFKLYLFKFSRIGAGMEVSAGAISLRGLKMNLRQRSSRYCNAVLFLAGINCVFLLAAIVFSGFQPGFEIWLASALVISLILHARAGFALSYAQQEIDMLQSLTEKIHAVGRNEKTLPKIKFERAANISADDAAVLDKVRDAIENDRVDLYLQPIVSLPQRKQRYFEAFSRLRNQNGTVLRPIHYLDAAERANRIGVIDNMILLRAVQALRNLGGANQHHRIFCNISPATIFDEDFFARFADYLDANADLAPKLVFEFTCPAVEILYGRAERNLQEIAERGFAFSVDHIRRLDHDWEMLRARNFQFVKASADMLLKETRGGDALAQARVKAFKDKLHDCGVDLIVEKVELEADMPEILALGIDYGQGDLFGPPRPSAVYVEPAKPLAQAS